jgi:tetratricopeptide (TPR) repeat protein
MALLAYANSFRAGLVYDNHLIVTQDPRVRQASAENVGLIFSKDYWYKNSVSTLYRPVATLSYLANYAVLGNGDSPAGYHAVNLAIHAINIALVYWLGWLMMAEFWPAFAMAALWAVHPVLTESVTNVVGRADLLAALGVLAGVLFYARSVADGRRAVLWQLALLLASATAIFSKESGIAVIAAVFLYDIAWCRNAPLRVRVSGYVSATLPVAIFLLVRAHVLAGVPIAPLAVTDNPLGSTSFLLSRLTAVKVLGKYLWLLIWPARLSCDYSYNQIPLVSASMRTWEDWQAVVALAVYAVAAVLAVLAFRRSRPVFFFIAFFFAAIAPTANIFLLIGTIMAERTLYLPSVAFAGLVAWTGWNGFQRLRPRWPALRTAAPALLAIVCLALTVRTFARNFDWYDEETLWASAAQSCPNSYRPHEHLANSLASPPRKDFDAAAREAERAIAILQPLPIEDRVAVAYATAGFCYRVKGDYPKALAALLEGVKIDQANDREFARVNRAAGKVVGPSRAVQVYLELGRTYRAMARYPEALEALGASNWSDPQTEFFEEISKTHLATGNKAEAVVALLEGITMGASEQSRLAAEVVELYRQNSPQSCALSGASINFGCPLVRDQLCLAGRNAALDYRRMHRDREAADTATGAIRSLGCSPELFR